jgi:hypothetical protein
MARSKKQGWEMLSATISGEVVNAMPQRVEAVKTYE